MAHSSAVTLDQADHTFFGTSSQLVDWQSGIAFFIPLAFLDWNKAMVARLLARRMSLLGKSAMTNFEAAMALTKAFEGELVAERDRIRAGLVCFSVASQIAVGDKPKQGESTHQSVRGALWDALEDEAQLHIDAAKCVLVELDRDIKAVDPEASWLPALKAVEPLISEALLESTQERIRLLREARKALRDAISQCGESLSYGTWAIYGWLSLQLDENLEATTLILQDALARPPASASIGHALCARLLAYTLSRQKLNDVAYTWAGVAAKEWPCGETYAERARYVSRFGSEDQIEREVAVYVKQGPLCAALVWADENMASSRDEILVTIAKEQVRLRKIITHEIAEWKKVSHKAKEAAKLAEDITLPHDLVEGASSKEQAIAESNFLTVQQLLAQAKEAKQDLKCLALAAFQNEKSRRAEALQIARMSIENAMTGRDDWLENAKQDYDQSVDSLREVMGLTEDSGEVVQKGCSRGLFGGCSVFGAYVVLAMILAARGSQVGPTTPFGIFALVLSSLPILGAVLYLCAYTSKRIIAESRATKEIAQKRDAFEASRTEANSRFRSLVESCQAEAAKQENRLHLAEQALKAYQT